MTTLHVELDDELVALLRSADQTADRAAREMIVLELYRRGAISSGKAAEVLGMSRLDFIQSAGRLGIPHFAASDNDLANEVEASRKL